MFPEVLLPITVLVKLGLLVLKEVRSASGREDVEMKSSSASTISSSVDEPKLTSSATCGKFQVPSRIVCLQ